MLIVFAQVYLRYRGASVCSPWMRPRPPGHISAGAERARARATATSSTRVYLRGCGASRGREPALADRGGVSPRVRSEPSSTPIATGRRRCISAGAERARLSEGHEAFEEVYLRGCGASTQAGLVDYLAMGVSPRVRSERQGGSRGAGRSGCISAGAERAGGPSQGVPAPMVYLRGCGASPFRMIWTIIDRAGLAAHLLHLCVGTVWSVTPLTMLNTHNRRGSFSRCGVSSSMRTLRPRC